MNRRPETTARQLLDHHGRSEAVKYAGVQRAAWLHAVSHCRTIGDPAGKLRYMAAFRFWHRVYCRLTSSK